MGARLSAQTVIPLLPGEGAGEGWQGMIERLGFPHPGPLPVGEGAQGASLTVSDLTLAPMPMSEHLTASEGKGNDRTR